MGALDKVIHIVFWVVLFTYHLCGRRPLINHKKNIKGDSNDEKYTILGVLCPFLSFNATIMQCVCLYSEGPKETLDHHN